MTDLLQLVMKEMKLNIGCGPHLLPGYLNIDKEKMAPKSSEFLRWDLEKTPMPLKNESVTEILADQILEHIHNFIPLMNNLHDLLKKGSTLKISVPHVPYGQTFDDPTHVRYFTRKTWEYFYKDAFLGKVGQTYGIKQFSHLLMEQHQTEKWNLLVELIK